MKAEESILFLSKDGDKINNIIIPTPLNITYTYYKSKIRLICGFSVSFHKVKDKLDYCFLDLTNDPCYKFAGSAGSLSYYSLRIELRKAKVISIDPFVLESNVEDGFIKMTTPQLYPLQNKGQVEYLTVDDIFKDDWPRDAEMIYDIDLPKNHYDEPWLINIHRKQGNVTTYTIEFDPKSSANRNKVLNISASAQMPKGWA